MGFAPGGVSKLSELEIDTHKDWGSYRIEDLGDPDSDDDAISQGLVLLKSLLTTIGDLLTRNGSEPIRLGSSYGAGYNFLNVKGDGSLQWSDIQAIIQYISGGLNVAILAPSLAIVAAEVVVSTAEDHSGGGETATPTVSVPLPAAAETVVEDHSGGQQTATPTEAIPVPGASGSAALV